MKARARKLVVEGRVYRYAVRHRHDVVESPGEPPSYEGCRERLMIRLDHPTARALTIVFEGGPDHGVGDGRNPSGMAIRWLDDWDETSMPPGVVARPSGVLNLHRPGVARAMLDEAIARGWDTTSALQLDGWDLFEAVRARLGPDAFRQHERLGDRQLR